MFLSLQKGSTKIESRKFLPLLYQLAARMSARSLATDPFQSTLQEVYMCMHCDQFTSQGFQ